MPILAGHYASRKKAILGISSALGCALDVPSQSLTSETTIRSSGARFHLLVLRYAPDTYPHRCGPDGFIAGLDDGYDATGPFGWKLHRYLSDVQHTSKPKAGDVRSESEGAL